LTGTPRMLPGVTAVVGSLHVLQDVPTASGQRHDVIKRDALRVWPSQVATDPTTADSAAPAIAIIDVLWPDAYSWPHSYTPHVVLNCPSLALGDSPIASPSMRARPRAEAFHCVLELTRQQEPNRSALFTAHLASGLGRPIWNSWSSGQNLLARGIAGFLPDATEDVDVTNDATEAGNGGPKPSRGAPRAPLRRRTFSHGRLEDNPAGVTDSRWVPAVLWLGHLGPSYRRMWPS